MYISNFGMSDLRQQLEKLGTLFKCDSTDLQEQLNVCLNGFNACVNLTVEVGDTAKPLPKLGCSVEYSKDRKGSYALSITTKKPLNNNGFMVGYSYTLDSTNLCKSFYDAVCDSALKIGYYMLLTYNADELTEYVNRVLAEEDVNETFEFAIGSKIFNLTDTHLGIGLSCDVLENLKTIMGTDNVMQQSKMRIAIVASFSFLPCILESLRRKTAFSTALKFYTWKTAKSIFRSAYHQSAMNRRNGFGYMASGDVFALVDSHVCTSEELEVLREKYGDELKVFDNKDPRSYDYAVAKSEDELEALKKRFEKSGCEYRVDVKEDNGKKTYLVVYRLYRAVAFCFHPCNLVTYETKGNAVIPDILQY